VKKKKVTTGQIEDLPKELVAQVIAQHHREFASAGGKARARKLTKEERAAISRMGGQAAAKARKKREK
jgi:hypothetical protein